MHIDEDDETQGLSSRNSSCGLALGPVGANDSGAGVLVFKTLGY